MLDGVRVVDLSTEIAGPYCTKLLADAGADVVKVETPPAGDPLRRWGPSAAREPGRPGALFEFLNTSKRSIIGTVDDPDVHDAAAPPPTSSSPPGPSTGTRSTGRSRRW